MAIRFISDKDYELLKLFFYQSNKIVYSLEEFKNRYSNNDSRLSMIYEIDETNEIAAFLGVFIEKASVNNNKVIACQFVDGLTNPKFRGKGYFKILALKVFDECKNYGCSFIFGFPNKMAYPVWKKLGWVFKENMKIINFYIPTFPLSLFFSKSKITMKIFNLIKKFEKNSDSLSYFTTTKENKDFIIHDLKFFNRKVRDNKQIITIDNVKLVVKFDKSLKVGLISDINDRHTFLSILKKLKTLCFFSGIVRLDFILHPNNTLLRFFDNEKNVSKHTVPVGFWEINKLFDFENFEFNLIDFDTY
ncbi:MAG: GNAT family N-acetyltransferase [Bacteroidetes bacterium]|nr:GNAT family N-acetyltransferase [Bacteroidota bacterium]